MKRLIVLFLFLVYRPETTECRLIGNHSTLAMNKLPLVRIKLSPQPFRRIIEALLPGLSENFQTVSVGIVQCPDLTQPPFNLAAKGLSGNETVIEVGSPLYMVPLVNRNKMYDIGDLKQITRSDPLFITGAGIGPWPYVGVNSQLVANVQFTRNEYVDNKSQFHKDDPETKSAVYVAPKNDTRFAVTANFFASNGLRGEVLRVECETRTGPLDFITSIRQALTKYFKDEVISLGGVVLIENSKVKVHVMPDFSTKPIYTEAEAYKTWLKFYELPAPMVGLGTIVSHDPGLDFRPQHFHVFSGDKSGGHYHHDTEPATIKYTAYFNVAKHLIRIDRPMEHLRGGSMGSRPTSLISIIIVINLFFFTNY